MSERERENSDRDGARGVVARNPKGVALGVVLLLLAWFGIANSRSVRVDFLVFEREVRLVVALAVSAALGACAALLARLVRRRDR